MSPVFTRTFLYTIVLLMGYTGKRCGLFRTSDSRFLSALILHITLPCAIVNGFQGVTLSPALVASFGVGLAANFILLGWGVLVSAKKSPRQRAFFALNLSSYNVGNFAMPFLTGMLAADGFAALCMFDIAVAMMTYGVNVAVADGLMGSGKAFSLKPMFKKIFTTPTFLMYLFLIAVSLFHISLPSLFLEVTALAGGANAFLAMLSIGILFDIKIPKTGLKDLVLLLCSRYALKYAMAFAVLMMPFPHAIRQGLAVVLVAPIASSAPLLTENAGADGQLSAVANSISIPLSIISMSVMLLISA